MTGQLITLDDDERRTLLMALFDRQEFLRRNLDRVKPAMAQLGEEDLRWHHSHKVNVFDEISALVIKLGGDLTADLFGALSLGKGDRNS